MSAVVTSFQHAATSTWTHVVSDPASGAAAIIDPVLDFDPVSGRLDTVAAREVLEHVRKERLDLKWILETHAHADHLTAAAWLRTQTGAGGRWCRDGASASHVQAHSWTGCVICG